MILTHLPPLYYQASFCFFNYIFLMVTDADKLLQLLYTFEK